MNLQYERIRHACEDLKLSAIATEWSAIADNAVANDQSLADFLEALLKIEIAARTGRTQSALLKFAGLPSSNDLKTTTSTSPLAPQKSSCRAFSI